MHREEVIAALQYKSAKNTVAWELFVVNKFSSVPYDDENEKTQIFFNIK